MRHKAAIMTNRAQKRGLLNDIMQHTLKTADPQEFVAAILARRVSYDALHQFYRNIRFKRLKLAMHARTKQTIEELIDNISYVGDKVVVLGDCSKTTGFKSCTPGGPVKKSSA